ncbi:MAG: sigma-70 family RNA polymerase sigma factor [Planctomycetota bacterium]
MPDASPLIQKHGDAVWRTSVRLLGDVDEAWDCYQETFLAALRHPDPGSVAEWSAWLRRVATNRAMDRLRQTYRRREMAGQLDELPNRATPVNPSARLESEELRDALREALTELPERQAEAFWLRHAEQLTPTQVAEHLGTTPANARQLVHRAATALRDRLADPNLAASPRHAGQPGGPR